ncbi:hypothetical protein SMA90_31605, partial [Escherichia coli]
RMQDPDLASEPGHGHVGVVERDGEGVAPGDRSRDRDDDAECEGTDDAGRSSHRPTIPGGRRLPGSFPRSVTLA